MLYTGGQMNHSIKKIAFFLIIAAVLSVSLQADIRELPLHKKRFSDRILIEPVVAFRG